MLSVCLAFRHHILSGCCRAGWRHLLIIALMLAGVIAAPGQVYSQDMIVSRVNDDAITRDVFHARVRFVRWQYINELVKVHELTAGNLVLVPDYVSTLLYNLENPLVLGSAVLIEMEQERLLWQTGADVGVGPTAEDVQAFEDDFFSLWTDVPAEQITTSDTAQVFIDTWYTEASAASGMSRDDIREIFATEALHSALFDYLGANVPTEEMAVQSRHILCGFHPGNMSNITPPTGDERAAAELCITNAQQRLDNGEAFEDVAATMSDDQSSAVNGGDLGWVTLSYLTQAYADAVRDADLNTLVGPVETEYGLHLIEVLDRRMQTLTEDEIEASKQGYFDLWINTLVDGAAIERSSEWSIDMPTDPGLDTLDPAVANAVNAFNATPR
ncbi:MAG: peptidylprolyl isomerase [Anaerolineae bacterium]|nr:peptidylprolyl isomerase [Anaerolineae bacterium]